MLNNKMSSFCSKENYENNYRTKEEFAE